MNEAKECPLCGVDEVAFVDSPTPARECTNCWEVRRRIDDFLVSETNRSWLREKLASRGLP